MSQENYCYNNNIWGGTDEENEREILDSRNSESTIFFRFVFLLKMSRETNAHTQTENCRM